MDKSKIAQAIAADACHCLVNTEASWLEQADASAQALAIEDSIIQKGATCAAGSHMLYNFQPPYQAEALDRAQAKAYAVVARCNMGEFAMGPSTSSWYGPCTLPGGLRCASGPAMAVAQGIAEVGLAVDEGGSALSAAALSGCAAFRPTYGAAPRFGLISYISSTEQLCAIAPQLNQAAQLMEAVSGHDAKDGTSLAPESWDFSSSVELKGQKVALLQPQGLGEEWQAALAQAALQLEAAGLSLEKVELPYLELAPLALEVMAAAEGCNNISRFDGVKYGYRTAKYKDMEELYRKSRSESMGEDAKYTAILGTYVLSKGRYEQYYYKALQVRGLVKKAFTELFADYAAVIIPGSQGPAPLLEEAEARFAADRALSAAPALAGLPVAALPWSLGGALPGALQVCADSNHDLVALAVAKILEGGC